MSEVWPISLCNIVAKIVSNVLSNQLRPILMKIIYETQSAFLPVEHEREKLKRLEEFLKDTRSHRGRWSIRGKCSVSFSFRTGGTDRSKIIFVLQMGEVCDQGRVAERTRGKKGKVLSQAGKEVLIKSVTSAIPNYVMNCFKLPVGIIDNLNSVMAKLFWANAEGDKGIHWKACDKLCLDKFEGGLGSRTLNA
ncbi:hypothetical protein LIER_40954 [Lithospermum erythrorhizon]|uniref:Reverse transcriptase n=1 Tax=Lithospermum erythrorhizon TaxID=34254 RepID=A0AAV3R593_LITER